MREVPDSIPGAALLNHPQSLARGVGVYLLAWHRANKKRVLSCGAQQPHLQSITTSSLLPQCCSLRVGRWQVSHCTRHPRPIFKYKLTRPNMQFSHMANPSRMAETHGAPGAFTVLVGRSRRKNRIMLQYAMHPCCPAEARAYTRKNEHSTHAHTRTLTTDTNVHKQANAHTNTQTHTRSRTRACILLCKRLLCHATNVSHQRLRGPTGKASAYGAKDGRLESCWGHVTIAGICPTAREPLMGSRSALRLASKETPSS